MGKLADEIIASAKKGGGKSPPPASDAEDPMDAASPNEESDYPGDEDSIAGDLADAVKSGDAGTVKDALKSFIEACYPQLAKG